MQDVGARCLSKALNFRGLPRGRFAILCRHLEGGTGHERTRSGAAAMAACPQGSSSVAGRDGKTGCRDRGVIGSRKSDPKYMIHAETISSRAANPPLPIRMSLRVVFLIAAAACLSGFAEKEVEDARDAFRSCLQDDVKGKIALRIDPGDFALSVRGACAREADRFIDAFVDYMSARFPTIDAADHIAKAREALDGWRTEAARSYVESLRRSGQ